MANNWQTKTALHAQQYDGKVLQERSTDYFFGKYYGDKPKMKESEFIRQKELGEFEGVLDSPIYHKTQLETNKGLKVTFGLMRKLGQAGVIDNTTTSVIATAEAMDANAASIELIGKSFTVKDEDPSGRQQIFIDGFGVDKIPASVTDALFTRILEDREDKCFTALEAAPTVQKFGGGVANKAALHATNSLLSPSDLRLMKILATTTGGTSRFLVDTFRPKGSGRNFLFAVTHPDILADLMDNTTFREDVQLSYNRGSFLDHPFFAGCAGVTSDGIALFADERSKIFVDGGAGAIPGGVVTIFGKQALATATLGWAPRLYTDTGEVGKTQYIRAYDQFAAVKPKFDSKDWGSVSLMVSRVKKSDA